MEHKSASTAIGGEIRVNETVTSKHLAQRAARRRPTYIAQAVSYLISAGILALYSYAGTITIAVSVAYLISGVTATATGLYLSEINFNDRFKDHYLTVPQTLVSTTIQLVAIYLAPEIGFYFIFILFIVLSFGALLMNARQTAIVWTYSTIGLTISLLMTDKAIAMPMATWTERALVLACAVNLNEEMARAQRVGVPCSVAIIDLDFLNGSTTSSAIQLATKYYVPSPS